MKEIRIGLAKGIDLSEYAHKGFDHYQLFVIREGLEAHLSPELFANIEFRGEIMREVVKGFKNNVDVTEYARNKFSQLELSEIRDGLQENLDVSIYAKKEFNWAQMKQIRLGLLQQKEQLQKKRF